MYVFPIKYRGDSLFSFCQENGVQTEEQPYIKYDQSKKTLSYFYGNNYNYSKGIDTDTLRRGEFKYINGQFIFDKETITVRKPTDN